MQLLPTLVNFQADYLFKINNWNETSTGQKTALKSRHFLQMEWTNCNLYFLVCNLYSSAPLQTLVLGLVAVDILTKSNRKIHLKHEKFYNMFQTVENYFKTEFIFIMPVFCADKLETHEILEKRNKS